MNSFSANIAREITNCRVCGIPLFVEPLLQLSNMPKAAQFLPDAQSVANDEGVDVKVCQCSGCGLVQLSNLPVPYYKEVIRAAAFSEEMKNFRMKQFGDFAQQFSLQRKKAIEIGCGRGEYLSLLQHSGIDAYGLEHAEESVALCLNNKLKVSRGYIDSSDCVLDNAPFDAFFILNYLEHLPDPNQALRGICNNLSDGALGLVEVPNFDMILRNNLFSEFIGDHLFYFTRETLTATLSQNGFEVIECKEVWYDYMISAVVKKRERLDFSHFLEYQTKIRNEIDKYLCSFGYKRVAIWGAGHQSLAIISLVNLTDKIRYVVDSAIFKQGKFTPATHIPIVSPDVLNSDPVDAVIVMAASYSDEVVGIIRQRFDKNINISILRSFGLELV